MTCEVQNCGQSARSAGSRYCEKHYYRQRRNGSLELPERPSSRLGVDGYVIDYDRARTKFHQKDEGGMSSWKEASRILWQTNGLPDSQISDQRLQIGCLQRIADATEAMAKNYNAMRDELDRYERYYKEERATSARLQREASALKGVITKLRNKQATEEASKA